MRTTMVEAMASASKALYACPEAEPHQCEAATNFDALMDIANVIAKREDMRGMTVGEFDEAYGLIWDGTAYSVADPH